MRFRCGGSAFLTTVLCVLFLTAPAMADIVVEFYDEEGNLVTDCPVLVRDGQDNIIEKLEAQPNGLYWVSANVLDKLRFEVLEPDRVHEKDVLVPISYFPPLTIQLGEQTGESDGTIPNDDCDDAIGISVPDTVSGTTTGAATDPGAIAADFCGTSVTSPSEGVWYTVSGTGNSITATTCTNPGGTDYDTKLTVWCDGCDELTCLGGDDDGSPLGINPDPACVVPETFSSFNRGSTVSWCSQTGAEYSVFVHGFSSHDGDFTLDISDNGAACNATVECRPEGGCCDGSSCSIATQIDCEASGAFYLGNDTSCTGDIVPGTERDHVDTPNKPIPEGGGTFGITTATINVPESFVIGDLDVDLILTHTFVGDLEISLTHPSGAPTILLQENECSLDNDMNLVYDDQGALFSCADRNSGANLRPPGDPLGRFNGLDAQGDWTLTIDDQLGGDSGTLLQWSLHLVETTNPCEACDPDPATQGYWHRQCLGVPEADGGIDPGRNGRGPSEPLEPDFSPDQMACADAHLEAHGFYGVKTCDGMEANPANDTCEKALKQLTALILNTCSDKVQNTCGIDLSPQGCSSTNIYSLIDELSAAIQGGDCQQAQQCAAALNGGQGAYNRAGGLQSDELEPERSEVARPDGRRDQGRRSPETTDRPGKRGASRR